MMEIRFVDFHALHMLVFVYVYEQDVIGRRECVPLL